MKNNFWNSVKRVMAGVMVAALLLTAGHGVGSSEPGISLCAMNKGDIEVPRY